MTQSPGETDPSRHEADMRIKLIDWIRTYRDVALHRDTMNTITRGGVAIPRAAGRFAVMAAANSQVPMQHHRFVYTPVVRHEPIEGIQNVFFRIPTSFYDSEVGLDSTGGVGYERRETPQWNDVFIELAGDGGLPMGKYLLNSGRLAPYETIAQTMNDTDTDVIFNTFEAQYTGDFFIAVDVEPSRGLPNQLTTGVLEQILKEYTFGLQDNMPDPQV